MENKDIIKNIKANNKNIAAGKPLQINVEKSLKDYGRVTFELLKRETPDVANKYIKKNK